MNIKNNRSKLLSIILVLYVTLFSNIATALENKQWKEFIGGAITTFVAHEAAHYVAAQVYDFEVDVENLSIYYPNDAAKKEQLRTSSIGFQAQWLASEYAFSKLEKEQTKNNAKKKSYYEGMVAGHVLITLANFFLLNNKQSDVSNIGEVTNMSSEQVLALALIPAGFDAARLWMDKPPKWLKNASITSKGLGIAAVWSY